MKLDLNTLKYLLKEAQKQTKFFGKLFEKHDNYEDMHAYDSWKNTAEWLENLINKNSAKVEFKSAYAPGALKKLKEKVKAGGYGKVNR